MCGLFSNVWTPLVKMRAGRMAVLGRAFGARVRRMAIVGYVEQSLVKKLDPVGKLLRNGNVKDANEFSRLRNCER